MDGLTKLERQEQIKKQVEQIIDAIDNVMPEEWNKPQIASVFQLYLELYR